MFWLIYTITSFLLSHLIAKTIKKNYVEIFVITLVFLITPVQVEIPEMDYAPALFTFIFNILFENNISSRLLKPLLISLPFSLMILMIYLFFKRRFF